MALSVLDLFSVGIGPSSSHTVGPMRAARLFTDGLVRDGLLESVRRVRAELFGSLGATGHGHGSDKAVILGLQGADPETVDTGTADARVQESTDRGQLCLGGTHPVPFDRSADVIMHRRRSLPAHPNGMTFSAHGADGELLRERTYYSVGGGFVVDGDATGADRVVQDTTEVPHPFTTGGRLLEHCRREGRSIAGIMLANEGSWRPEEDTRASDFGTRGGSGATTPPSRSWRGCAAGPRHCRASRPRGRRAAAAGWWRPPGPAARWPRGSG